MEVSALHILLIAWIGVEWVLRILALFVVPRNRKPNSGMSWLLFIFLMPGPGWVAFLIFGFSNLPKERRDAQVTLDGYIQQAIQYIADQWKDEAHLIETVPPEKYRGSVALSTGLTHLPLFAGNNIEPIAEYDNVIARLAKDIKKAKHYIQVEYYILALDAATETFFTALEAAVERGVEVRVLYDAFGSRKFPRKKEMLARLKNARIEVHAMLPLHLPGKKYTRPDLRNHRKLVVIDGVVGYTGSLNMIQRDYHRKDSIVYDELVVRLEGPVVLQLEAVFLNDWLAETGQVLREHNINVADQLKIKGKMTAHVVPSGPGYKHENNRKFFTSLFHAAEKSITIVNPYFVPDQSLSSALTSAAARGVKVKIINSEAIDQIFVAHAQRSYYEEMLRAGVEIYLYKQPALLHSKFAIIDDDACFVGSSNMDIRSFELNQELTLTSYDGQFVAEMQKITDSYIGHSQKIKKDEWLRRPPRKQLLDNIARLTSSLQ
jgi:cardiolipin synthase